MKVYAVTWPGDWESGPVVDSIWSTKDLAETEIVRLYMKYNRNDNLFVKEWNVDEPHDDG